MFSSMLEERGDVNLVHRKIKTVKYNVFFFDSILDFAIILSDFKVRNVIFWHLTIITARKMFSKKQDKIVHVTSLQ